jgi:PAS domain S-box-containing protein
MLHSSFAWPYVAAIAVPVALLAAAGWLNLRQIEDEAFRRIARASQALSEHAQRTFRTHEVIIDAVDRHIAGWSWEHILASRELHEVLAQLAKQASDVASVFVMHPGGGHFNSSRRFPMPAIDGSDRDYYKALREHDVVHVSEPMTGRLSNDRFFSIARRRALGASGFDGVISVSVNPEYFEKFYETMTETAQDSVVLVRRDGVVLARYPRAEREARIPAANFEKLPAGGTTRVRSAIDGVERLAAFRPVGDYGVYAGYGLSKAAVWATWRKAMIPYAVVTLLAAAALVFAARRRDTHHAETARRGEEERLRRWTDAVPALVSYIDRDLRYRFNNRAYENWFGVRREAMVGRHVAEVLGEAAYEKLKPHFEAALAGRSVTYEALAPYRDGGPRHIQASYIPDVGPDGVRGMFVLVLDITARKQAELALAESDRAKDEFLAMLAHELRNPLAPIVTALEVMKRTAAGSPEALELRAMLERQAAHLARLVDDLLDVSRISRGRLEVRRSPIAIADLVAQALETCRPHLEAAGHHVELAMPSEPLYVDADRVRMVQALSNLINNAAKYTRAGGLVSVSAGHAGERVEIRVRDTGIGIAPEMLARVFDMFARAEHSYESAGGLGIGLTLAKRIAELHDGTLSAHSEGLGRGAQFTLSLPLAPAPSAVAMPAPRPPHQPASGRRVLVIDDNEDAAASLAALLRLSGNDAMVVHDGEEGVRAAISWRPEVILLDIGLPKLNGYEACRRLRAHSATAGARIIALTGWGQEQDRKNSRDAGFDAHLVKPVDYDELDRLLGASPAASQAHARAAGRR